MEKAKKLKGSLSYMVSKEALMKKLLLLLFLFPLTGKAHPGIGLVKDSKGTLYYTDLQQIWKVSKGQRSIAVPGVHTHELYMDKDDNLYGEHQFGGSETSNRFFHYLWVLRPTGNLDTIVNAQEAYLTIDFSLARDKYGNEYYTKQYLKRPDTNNIYKKLPDGTEVVLAKGNYKGVTWLHPQDDGSLLFAQHNNVYRLTKEGDVKIIASNIANDKPSFAFSGNSKTVWGIWQDDSTNVYVAVFSDQTVRKINTNGQVTDIYQSKGNWAPLYGVFDEEGQVWVLESSDKNEVRLTMADSLQSISDKRDNSTQYIFIGTTIVALTILLLFLKLKH